MKQTPQAKRDAVAAFVADANAHVAAGGAAFADAEVRVIDHDRLSVTSPGRDGWTRILVVAEVDVDGRPWLRVVHSTPLRQQAEA